MPNDPTTRTVSSPFAKFCIGVLAGCAAIAIPRLSSFLVSSKDVSGNFFPSSYIAAAIIFAVLIGLLVMVMEFKIPRPPKETLFAALAVPGLIAGSLNTAVESQEASRMFEKANGLSKEARNWNGIEIKKIDSMEIIPINFSETEEIGSNSDISFGFITSAHAADNIKQLTEQSNSYGVSVQREAPKYAISLGNLESKENAIQEVKKMRNQNVQAVLIKVTDGYEVLASDKILSETDATIEALELKSRFGVTPKLLQVR